MAFSRRDALRWGVGAVVAGMAFPTVSACGSSGSNSSTATYQLSWLKNAQWGGSWIADDRGYYRQAGLDLTIAGGGPQVSVEPRIASGNCLVGNTYGTGAAQANRNGADIRIIGVMLQKSPTALISPAGKPLLEPGQLAGKRIGISSIQQPVFALFSAANGLDGKVTTVPVQQSLDPLTTGQVDAMLTYVTQTATLDLTGFATAKLFLADHGYADIPNAYGVSADVLKNRRDEVVRFMRGEIRGWQDFVADPDVGADLAVRKYGPDLGLNPAEQRIEAKQVADLATANPIVAQAGLMRMSDQVKAGALSIINAQGGRKFAAGDLFDDSVLDDVYHGTNRL